MSLNHLVAPPAGAEVNVTARDLTVVGDATVDGMLTATGGIESSGPLLELNVDGGAADAIGFFAPRDADAPGPDVYCGLVRDGSVWYLLDDSATAPPDADLGALGDLNVQGFNASAAATVEGAFEVGGASLMADIKAQEVDAEEVLVGAPAVVVNSTGFNQAGVGFYAPITPIAPGPLEYAGLLREAGDDRKWHLVDGVTLPPPDDLLSSHGNLEVDTLKCRVLNRVEELKVDDPLFEVNAAAADDTMAVGFYAQQIPVGPTYYTGLVREPAAKIWHLIDNSTLEPPNAGSYAFLGVLKLADFEATGGVTVGGALTATNLDRPAAGALLIGGAAATSSITLGKPAAALNVPGLASYTDTATFSGVTAINCIGRLEHIGDSLELGRDLTVEVNVAKAGVTTTIHGNLEAKQNFSVAGSMSSSLAMGGNSVTGAGAVTTNSIDRPAAGTLTIGTGANTSAVTLGKVGAALSLPGQATFTDLVVASNGIRTTVVDRLGANLVLGAPNATGVDIGVAGALTTVAGDCQVNEDMTVVLTSSLQGATTFGFGGTSYTLPTTRGLTGQILVEDGGGAPAWTSLSTGQVYASSGILTAATGYGVAWAQSSTVANAAEGVTTRHFMLRAGTITRMAYNTASGTATSEYAIRLNGADATTFLGTGAVGSAVVAVAVAIGDIISLRHTGVGVDPDNSILTILVT